MELLAAKLFDGANSLFCSISANFFSSFRRIFSEHKKCRHINLLSVMAIEKKKKMFT